MTSLLFIILTLFTTGNDYYAAGDWDNAVQTYEQCLADTTAFLTDDSQAEVYYNLGNARFRQGELSQSILAYERCLRLQPRHKDAQYNLAFAKERIVDDIADNRTFFIASWAAAVRNKLTCRTWTILSICLFITMLTAMLLFALVKPIWLRKLSFHVAWITMLLSLITGLNAISLNSRDTKQKEAIVTQGVLNAKASPDKSGTDLFTLHEGTKVEIQEVLGEWANVRVGNNEGWVKLSHIERI
ncbi:MAG: tetratricopeptide repeat protein [Paludibacteraceae bacterium]|nr:tetratricopeptide repeat protein [Paludibacteraceae bacterium]